MRTFSLAAALGWIGPNVLFVGMLLASVAYYQETVHDAPTWRNVAAGSMAIVGTLAGLGYRDFIKRLSSMENRMQEDWSKRDRQHQANVAAIVALAIASASAENIAKDNKQRIQEIVDQLLKERNEPN